MKLRGPKSMDFVVSLVSQQLLFQGKSPFGYILLQNGCCFGPFTVHFGIPFWAKLGLVLGPFWGPFGGIVWASLWSENTRKHMVLELSGCSVWSLLGALLGAISGPILGSFWAPFWVHFGALLKACPPPLISSRNRLSLFHNNCRFNSIPAPAAGFETTPAHNPRDLAFSLFHDNLVS